MRKEIKSQEFKSVNSIVRFNTKLGKSISSQNELAKPVNQSTVCRMPQTLSSNPKDVQSISSSSQSDPLNNTIEVRAEGETSQHEYTHPNLPIQKSKYLKI